MKQGDLEFHERAEPIKTRIAHEGLRIAKENEWSGIGIRITHRGHLFPGRPRALHCELIKTVGESEIDEPSAVLLDDANKLFDLFEAVGTPLAGMTMDWIEEKELNRVHRECKYTYK